MKRLFLLFALLFGVLSASAQLSAQEKEQQFIRNVETFKSQNFTVAITNWVNYPNDIGGDVQIMRDTKIECTPTGITMNVPVKNKALDNSYNTDRSGAFRVFDFKNAAYTIENANYSKNKKSYKAIVLVKDPNDSGMKVDFIFLNNGTAQIIINAISYERTVLSGYIIPRVK